MNLNIKRPARSRLSAEQRRRCHLRDLALGVGALFAIMNIPFPGTAATAANGITVIKWGNDRWYNYDFNSESAASNNVDWAISLLFTNNATINKTKSRLDDWTTYDQTSTERKHERLTDRIGDDSRWGWDRDGGKKTITCPVDTQARHYRIYSTENSGQERLYNSGLGYYVIGSTHSDWNECGLGVRHGGSEATEMNLINQADEDTFTNYDAFGLYNEEPWRVQGSHEWSNDGSASVIKIS